MHLSHLTSDDRPWTIEDARLRIHTLGLGEDTGHASDNEISSASKVLRELNLFEKERVWKLRDMWRLQHGQAGRVKDGDGVRQGFNPGESFDEPSVTESCPAPVQKNYLSYIAYDEAFRAHGLYLPPDAGPELPFATQHHPHPMTKGASCNV